MAQTLDMRMNDFAQVTDCKYIYVEDANGNQVKVNKEVLYSRLLEQSPSLTNSLIYGSNQKFSVANYKILGNTPVDAGIFVMLLFPYDRGQKVDFRGVTGSLFFFRGGLDSGGISSKSDILINRSYIEVKVFSFSLGDSLLKKMGICSYNGIEYIALKFEIASYCIMTFNGLYTPNTLFTSLPISSVVWNEDL